MKFIYYYFLLIFEKKTMKTLLFESDRYYHVYNRGNNKETIFETEANYFYFLKLLKKYIIPVATIYSYCLLPNHFHLILKIKDTNALPENIKSGKRGIHQPFSNLFNAYAKAYNKMYNRTGSLFQKNVKRIEITDEVYLRNLIVYVNTNSSHHGIADFTVYKHSSYNAIISDKPTLLQRNDLLDLFDGVVNFIYMHKLKKDMIGVNNRLAFD